MENYTLLTNIARCPITHQIIQNPEKSKSLPCYKVVKSQPIKSYENFQLPEPWGGHIDKAPILFLSSNPSISLPRKNDPLDVEVQLFFPCVSSMSPYPLLDSMTLIKNLVQLFIQGVPTGIPPIKSIFISCLVFGF